MVQAIDLGHGKDRFQCDISEMISNLTPLPLRSVLRYDLWLQLRAVYCKDWGVNCKSVWVNWKWGEHWCLAVPTSPFSTTCQCIQGNYLQEAILPRPLVFCLLWIPSLRARRPLLSISCFPQKAWASRGALERQLWDTCIVHFCQLAWGWLTFCESVFYTSLYHLSCAWCGKWAKGDVGEDMKR